MRKELTALTEITKEMTGDLPGGETVRYLGMHESGRGLGSVHTAVTRRGRQVLTINRQRKGRVGYNFPVRDDFEAMEIVIDEALSNIDNLYDEAGSESVRLTIEDGIITGVSNDWRINSHDRGGFQEFEGIGDD